MPHLVLTQLTIICVVTFISCVISLGNHTLRYDISGQQTSKHQTSEQKTSRHQTSEQQTSRHQTSEQQTSRHETSDQQTSRHQISEQQTSRHQTSDQQTSRHDTLTHDTSEHHMFEHDNFGYHTFKHKTSGHQTSENQNLGHEILGNETSGHQSSRHKKITGCTAPPLLPTKPFIVVWNHPTGECRAHGVDLDFDKWGIVDNNHDSFIGEEIVLFYKLGQFPQYSGSTAYNGGIPQLGNLTSHLQKAGSDISKNIPCPSFSGLGVMDFEAWRPLFYLNFDALKIYQTKSVELARQKFPHYNTSQILQEAMKEFQKAARTFMETTLQQASLARPSGRWGYYGYPRCWDTYCNTSTVAINNLLSWIYNNSTGLYPSIYFKRGVPDASRATMIHNIIHETLRVKATWSSPDAVILPYSLNQDSAYDLFNEPANMGSSGVVLWGSSNYMQAKNECLILQEYINTTLGPFVFQVTSFFVNCSQQLCEGHGRCVRKDYEQYYQYYLRKRGYSGCIIPDDVLAREKKKAQPNKRHGNYIFGMQIEKSSPNSNVNPSLLMDDQNEQTMSDFDDYVCKCFAGWSGIHCNHTTTE